MDTALPSAPLLRVIKGELPPGFHINKEAKVALSRAGAIFALYLATAAGDVKDPKRSVVQASDVLRALEEVELPEFADALRGDLQSFKDEVASKRKRKKRPAAAEGGVGGEGVDGEGEGGEGEGEGKMDEEREGGGAAAAAAHVEGANEGEGAAAEEVKEMER